LAVVVIDALRRAIVSNARTRHRCIGELRRRHGLVLVGEPQEPGHQVEDSTWEAKRVRSSTRGG
jgi:hypothetical protein